MVILLVKSDVKILPDFTFFYKQPNLPDKPQAAKESAKNEAQ